MPRLPHYMAQYDHEHGSPWNKLLRGVGIPLIFAGIILLSAAEVALGSIVFRGRLGSPVRRTPDRGQ